MKKIKDFVRPIKAKKPIKEKLAKEIVEKKAIEKTFKIHKTLDPKKIFLMTCPFCEEKIKIKGISGHIRLKHNISGVSLQDLDDVKKRSKSLDSLVCEKFNNKKEIKINNISIKVAKNELASWKDIKSEEADQEEIAKQDSDQEKIDQEKAKLRPDKIPSKDKKTQEDDKVKSKNGGGFSLASFGLFAALALIVMDRLKKDRDGSEKSWLDPIYKFIGKYFTKGEKI